jgi:hypothetical protein
MNAILLLAVATVGQAPTSVTINWTGLGRGHVVSHTEVFNGTYALTGGMATDMSKDAAPVWNPSTASYSHPRQGIRVVAFNRGPDGGGYGVALMVSDGVGGWQAAGGTYSVGRTLPAILMVPAFPGDTTHFIRVD